MSLLNHLSPAEVGRRLRVARENANINIEESAVAIGVSRDIYASIESGIQLVQFDELVTLTKLYRVTANGLMRPEAVHVNLIPKFRRLNGSQSKAVIEAAKLLNNLVRAEVELENILAIKRATRYPEEKDISFGNVELLGTQHARELRNWLDIGSGPIANIFSLVEFDIGIRLFQRNISESISGLFVYDDSVGACILVNASHPLRQRVYSISHELGHFIGTRDAPETFEKNEEFASREEQYADIFARSFLAPEESFTEAFKRVVGNGVRIESEHIIRLAYKFGVSEKFCVQRLEELELVKEGTWNWFQSNRQITPEHVKEVFGVAFKESDSAKAEAKRPISHGIGVMATRAWEQELLSEGQLVELLGLDRITLRTIFNENQSEERITDDILEFSV